MENRNIRLEKRVVEVEFVEEGDTSKISLPKKIFGMEGDYNFVAIKKDGDYMIKLFPYLKNQRLFEIYAEIKEGQLDTFYKSIVKIIAETDSLNLTGMDGLCTKNCVFDGCVVVDGLAEVVVDDLRNKLEALGIVKQLDITEVK